MPVEPTHTSNAASPTSGRVLVAGAGGYIGGRLALELLARGHQVRCLVIGAAADYRDRWPGAEVVAADARDRQSLLPVLAGVDTAYYLIHSLLPGAASVIDDAVSEAAAFREAAAECGVARIIYLGSLADARAPAASLQATRLRVARELRAGAVPVTELRADVIIGSGSASYEIIRNLALRLPLVLIPPWARLRRLPVWTSDVVACLADVGASGTTAGGSYELCGEEITYEQMLRITAAAAGKRRRFQAVPLARPSYYAYAASLLTPVPYELARAVIDALGYEADCRDRSISRLVPWEPRSFEAMLRQAIASETGSGVVTRWSDAWPHEYEKTSKLDVERSRVTHRVSRSMSTTQEAADLFVAIGELGGERGWLRNEWLWRIRGGFDRLIKGVGSGRGRKRHKRVEVNEAIGFWRVEALEPDRRLLLRAEMKLPGRGWLELEVEDQGAVRCLSATAYFIARGWRGRVYWYAFYPFHGVIFRRLLKGIDERSAAL